MRPPPADPGPTGARAADIDVPGGPADAPPVRQRLHPLSPLLHSAKALFFIVAAISWQGFGQLGPVGWAGAVGVLLLGAVALSVVSWYATGYQVVGRELRISEGVLWRRTRAIPLERLQAVEVVRPLLARLTGLAELRLEVVGGAKTEAPLAYLGTDDARALRHRLLVLAGRRSAAADRADPVGPAAVDAPVGPAADGGAAVRGAAAAGAPTGADGTAPATGGARPVPGGEPSSAAADHPPPARPLHAVANRDLVVSQLLTPQVWSVPFALALVLSQAVFEARFSFIGVASTLTAAAGVLLQPARRVLDDWAFRVARDPSGLRLRHGLLETRSQIVPIDRVQAVRVTWPLLWRGKRWLRIRLDIAGLAGPEEDQRSSSRLLPVGDLATARRLLPEVLPGVDLAGLPLVNPPVRARWLAPLAQPRMGVALGDQMVAAGEGVLTRQLTLVPYARIQSVRVVQGRLSRALGLATVYADTAGGLAAVGAHRDLADARRLAAELSERARAARSR